MSRNKFEPFNKDMVIEVKCGHGHKNEYYRIAYGDEQWGDTFANVIKIQIVNDDGIQGRKVPSFKLKDLDDIIKGLEKIKQLANIHENTQ